MALHYDKLMALKARDERFAWSDRDAMLYALAVGAVRDARDPRELAFAYEGSGPKVVPTFANTLAFSEFLKNCGWHYQKIVHSAERLVMRRALRPSGAVLVDSDVVHIDDRGPESGAVIVTESRARDAADGQPMFSLTRTILARGDGGFGGPRRAGAPAHVVPARPADLSERCVTRPDQALLYRLCGDRNALHADPAVARALSLNGPILHGLCTFGITCATLLRTICEFDPTLVREFEARFTGPVYPGDPLLVEMWQDGAVVSFRVTATERSSIVLDSGRCLLAT
jgi:acyl dehydratase